MFADKAAHDKVKCVSLKLSQGAKPGIGGVLPAAKVTPRSPPPATSRRARSASVPAPQGVLDPARADPFIAHMRELAGGKPAGFKLCVGSRHELLAICKAMVEEGTSRRTSSSSTAPRAARAPRRWSTRTTSAPR